MSRSLLPLLLLAASGASPLEDPGPIAAQAAAELKAARYAEAETLFEKALTIWKQRDTPSMAWAAALGNRGTLASLLGDYARAETAFVSALDMAAPLVPACDICIARLRIGLGQVYIATGRLAEARSLTASAVPACERNETDHGSAADAMGRLAQAEARLPEAEEWFRRAVDLRQRTHGPRDIETIIARNNLAVVLRARGDLDGAEKLHRETLADYAAVQRPEHPVGGALLNGLGQIQQARGDWNAARESFEKALESWHRSAGPAHPLVAGGLLNLAALHQSRRHYDRAEGLLLRSLEISRKAFPRGNHRVAMTLSNLASLHAARKRFTKAEAALLESLAMLEATTPAGHPGTGLVMVNLGEVYRARKDSERAGHFYARGLAILEANWQSADPRLLPMYERYSTVLRQRSDFAEAERTRAKAMRIRVRQSVLSRTSNQEKGDR